MTTKLSERTREFTTSVAPEWKTSTGLLIPMRRQEELTNRPTAPQLAGVSVVIPCYNEELSITDTVRRVMAAMEASGRVFEILVVDDGSADSSTHNLQTVIGSAGLRLIRNGENCGYGYSLKRGIAEARSEWIAIVDADGTYPIERLPDLLDSMEGVDMVVGARVGPSARIPLARRPAKWVLRKLAEFLAERPIADLNSGMRVFKKTMVRRFLRILPDGFSFTTTITLAHLTHGHEVRYVPINYASRVGKSSIRPIRDTMNFFSLIVRTVLYFRPLKIFLPASAVLIALAVAIAVLSKVYFGQVADVTAVTVASAALQLLAIGMLADLIDKRWPHTGSGAATA